MRKKKGKPNNEVAPKTSDTPIVSKPRMTIKEWLMSDKARGELIIPDRKSYCMRPPPDFSQD